MCEMTDGNGRNRVAVGNHLRMVTQGSSCLSTLGFGTESRWDSQTAAFIYRCYESDSQSKNPVSLLAESFSNASTINKSGTGWPLFFNFE